MPYSRPVTARPRCFDPSFDPTRTYRYTLYRAWPSQPPAQRGRGHVCWVMLNPSTADATVNDPTINRCVRFSIAWGYDSLAVVNLFALRATDPRALFAHPDPVGEGNDGFILREARAADLVVCAWGRYGTYAPPGSNGTPRSTFVRGMLANSGVPLHALKVTTGQPHHPLYLKGDSKPFPLPE